MAEEQHNKVDLRSAAAYFLVKWKLILLMTIACAVLAGALGYYRKSHQPAAPTVSYEQKVESARSALTEEDAAFTEQVYNQYLTYYKRLNDWNAYLTQSPLQNMDPYNYVRMDLQYAVQSNNGDAIQAFSASLLGRDHYKEIAADIGEDDAYASYLNELIVLTNVAQNTGTSDQSSGGEGGQTELIKEVGDVYNGVLSVVLIAGNEEQLDAMVNVLEKAIEDKSAEMGQNNTWVTIRRIDTVITENDAKSLLNMQQMALSPMITQQTNRSNFVKNTVETMTDEERAYFDLLCAKQEEKEAAAAPARKIHLKKYLAAGAAGGFFLSLLILYIAFAFSKKILYALALSENFGLFVLSRFRVGVSKSPLGGADMIRRKGLEILGGSPGQTSEGAASLAAEVLGMMRRDGEGTLFIACDNHTENVLSVMKQLQKDLEEISQKSVTTVLGSPMENGEDYKALLGADAVLIAETLGQSEKETLWKLIETCTRNQIDVLGCASVLDDSHF